jgi:hypothetical protein
MAQEDVFPIVANAAGRFANSLRLYIECKLTSKTVFNVDPEEAIDNVDRAFDAILGSIHSLYDAMKEAGLPLDWHSHGEMEACIIVRNARHHNASTLFESWNCRMLKKAGLEQKAGATFLLVGYDLVAKEGLVAEYYVPFDDFRLRLAMPDPKIKKYASVMTKLLDQDCSFNTIRKKAESDRYPLDQVYLNMIPLVMNTASRAFGSLRAAGVALEGSDAKTLSDHFAPAAIADLGKPMCKSVRA